MQAAAGYRFEDRIYLAVWNLGGDLSMSICLKKKLTKVLVEYPLNSLVTAEIEGDFLRVRFTENIPEKRREVSGKSFGVCIFGRKVLLFLLS